MEKAALFLISWTIWEEHVQNLIAQINVINMHDYGCLAFHSAFSGVNQQLS